MWGLIVSVPDHCLSFYFNCRPCALCCTLNNTIVCEQTKTPQVLWIFSRNYDKLHKPPPQKKNPKKQNKKHTKKTHKTKQKNNNPKQNKTKQKNKQTKNKKKKNKQKNNNKKTKTKNNNIILQQFGLVRKVKNI